MDRINNSEEDSDLDQAEEEQAEAKAYTEPSRNFVKFQSMHEKTSTFFNQSIVKAIDQKQDIQPSPKVVLNGRNFKSIHELSQILSQINNLTTLKLINCTIETLDSEVLPPISTLKYISFKNCIDNIFKAFIKQNALTKIEVSNNDSTCDRFPHDIFNEICGKCKNLEHVVLDGIGTGSYFDNDDFPYKIKKLETSMITFNWYVGLKNARVNFLKSQERSLKELTIHELPYDFDGGEVLKYIIEEMNLDTFYYGKIPLILNGKKQEVKEFEASEIQITSAIEIIKQFKCEKFTLKLSKMDVLSDDIGRIINISTFIFDNIKEFEVVDNSTYRGIFGVFLGLYRNLHNLEKLSITTMDSNINVILNEFHVMPKLKELHLVSTAPEASERYQTVLKFAPNLKIIKVPENNVEEARGNLGDNIDVVALNEANAPGNLNDQRGNEEAEQRNRGGGDDDDDEGDRDEDYDGFPPDSTILGNIVERTEPSPVRSSFNVPNETDSNYYMHPFGYYKNILTRRNERQLKRLLGEELNSFIFPLKTEQGKILIEFHNKIVEDDQHLNRNQLRDKLKNLAFTQHNRTDQLPLVLLARNELFMMSCCINSYTDWDTFMIQISYPNGLCASRWIHHETEEIITNGNRMFKITFFVDAKNYIMIQQRTSRFTFNRTLVDIDIVGNPYLHDIQLLPVDNDL